MITSANILATSFEVPRTSPVAHVKFFLATNAIIIPDNNPMVIPIIPNMLRVKNPTAEAKINDSNSNFLFIDSMKNLPVPSENGFEKVAQVIMPILAAISETRSI